MGWKVSAQSSCRLGPAGGFDPTSMQRRGGAQPNFDVCQGNREQLNSDLAVCGLGGLWGGATLIKMLGEGEAIWPQSGHSGVWGGVEQFQSRCAGWGEQSGPDWMPRWG